MVTNIDIYNVAFSWLINLTYVHHVYCIHVRVIILQRYCPNQSD